MEIIQIKQMLVSEIQKREEKITELKQNIHSDYILAKLDFTVIDNLTDSINTFTNIIETLDRLQQRIIERNRGE